MYPETQNHHFAKIATIVFIMTYFFIKINANNETLLLTRFEKLEAVILTVLLCVFLPAAYKYTLDAQKISIIMIVMLTLVIIQMPYMLIYHYSPLVGDFKDYVFRFFRLLLYIILLLGYSLFLFNEEYFIKIFWKIGYFIMVISIAAYLAYEIFGFNYLLHFYGDTPRIQGFFTEPSTFAPMLSVFAILAMRRKKYITLALVIVCVFLTKSPIVILTMGLSLPIIFLAQRRGKAKKIVTTLVIFVLLVFLQQTFNNETIQLLLNSKSDTAYSIGRLFYGFQNILTNGELGNNDRFEGAVEVYNTLKNNDLLWFGYGLNSSSVYFLQKFGSPRDYSLFLTMFFSYGMFGLTMFIFICWRTLLHLRKIESEYLYIYIPFLVASTINSAQGFVSYGFVFVAIFAYWIPKHFKSKSLVYQKLTIS